jgi:hypothetical protein
VRAGRSWVIVVVAVAASCGAAGFPTTESEGGKPWRRVDAQHISLVSHQDLEAARDTAEQLEVWWQAMSQALPVWGPDVSSRLTALAVRNGWEADSVSPSVRGAFLTFPPIRLLYIGDPDNVEGARVIRHELAHAFIGARLQDAPTWLNEGLAKYLETAEYNPQTSAVTSGAMNFNEVREVSAWRRPTVATIVAGDWPASDRGLLTFRAGILVHMLINRHESEMNCFIAALARRESSRDAFARCFTTCGRWEFEMQDYEWSVSFPTRAATVAPLAAPVQVSSVSDAQVHTLLGLLDFGVADLIEKSFRDVHVARGQGNLKRALELDGTDPLAVVAVIQLLPDERPRFDALTAGLVRAHPDDWCMWRLRAGTPGLAVEEAQRACEEMGKLAPDHLEDAELSPCSRD